MQNAAMRKTLLPIFIIATFSLALLSISQSNQLHAEKIKVASLEKQYEFSEQSIKKLKEELLISTQNQSKNFDAEKATAKAMSIPYRQNSRPPAEVRNTPESLPEATQTKVDPDEVSAQLARVESLIALTAEQREKLRSKLSEETEVDIQDQLRAVLGDESYQRYEEERQKFRARMREERIEQELFRISRKIGLDAQQEVRVNEIIRKGRDIYFPPDSDQERGRRRDLQRMREWMEKEEQRQQYNAQELKAVLNEQQYNNYLQLQAENTAMRSHQSYLNALPTPSPTK